MCEKRRLKIQEDEFESSFIGKGETILTKTKVFQWPHIVLGSSNRHSKPHYISFKDGQPARQNSFEAGKKKTLGFQNLKGCIIPSLTSLLS